MGGEVSGLPVLTLLIAIPLVAAAIALFLNASGARWIALIATLLDFALSIDLWANFDPNGAQWQFVGIEVEWDSLERLYAEVGLATRLPSVAWRMSVPLYSGSEQAGYATSGGWSPLLKKYIALAHLRSQWAARGTLLEMEMTVEHRRKRALARVVKKPFFDPERKRK